MIPDGIWVTLKYVDLLNVSGNPQANFPYSGNGVFDPYTAVGGHQPRGFDNWCSASGFYTDYRVPYSSVTVRGSDSSFNGEPIQYYIYPSVQSSFSPAIGDRVAFAELPYIHTRYPDINNNTSSRVVRMKHKMSARKIFGASYDKTDTQFIGNYSSNPAQQWYWHIGAYNMTGTTVSGYIQIEITYRVYFFNRTVIGQS